jgi:hypothetical protein
MDQDFACHVEPFDSTQDKPREASGASIVATRFFALSCTLSLSDRTRALYLSGTGQVRPVQGSLRSLPRNCIMLTTNASKSL